ncbi:phytoene desaturase family protein [Trichloromonas sp.]|uniref:phytoene desaturase family protein n=1 Tax=Trichloromonas sp. TaxID=3069249 RepID=UPI003D81362D
MRYDYLIIGSGVSGLTSAAVLASEGYRVALIEKSSRIAPLLRGFSRRGVYFDTGFHYSGGLTKGGPFDTFLRYLGLADRLQTTSFDHEGFDVVRTSGRTDFAYPVGPERLRERLVQEFPAEAKAIDSYLAEVRQVCTALPYLDMETGFDGPGYFAGLNGASLRQVLDRLTGNAALKRLLCVHTLLYGVPPEEVPFTLHAAIVGPYYQSVHGLKGGGGSLVTAFEGRLAELGVDIFCGRGARDILFSDAGTLQGVRLEDGDVIEGTGCVATMHPTRLLGMVPEGVFRPVYHRRLARLEDTSSAFILYALCDGVPDFLRGRNLFLLDEEGCLQEQTIYLTAAEASAGGAGGFIAICADSPDATRQWGGSTTGRRADSYGEYKQSTAAKLLRRIESSCPELSGRVDVVETATPLTMRDYVHAPSGALYGVKHKVGQYNPMAQTRAKNLFLAGQATASPGVMGGMLSGFLACETIVGHDRLRNKVKACR